MQMETNNRLKHRGMWPLVSQQVFGLCGDYNSWWMALRLSTLWLIKPVFSQGIHAQRQFAQISISFINHITSKTSWGHCAVSNQK